jgi:AsmA-like C-terminal region
MHVSLRIWRRLAIAVGVCGVVVGLAVAIVWIWLIPRVIIGRLEQMHAGKVSIEGWWINARSAGVRGLALHETKSRQSPIWARTRAVSTDLNWRRVLSGQLTPRRVTVRSPRLTIRFDDNGTPLTQPRFGGRSAGNSAIPVVVVEDAHLTLTRPGQPNAMLVSGIQARVVPRRERITFSARTDDPAWKQWTVSGDADSQLASGSIVLSGRDISDAYEKIKQSPFIPRAVGDHVQPDGELDVVATVRWSSSTPLQARTTIKFLNSTVSLPTLGLSARETTGTMVVEGAVVSIPGMTGQAMGGRVDAQGTLDFRHSPSLIDLNLKLNGINVAQTPPRWQIQETGITGRLTGSARLKAALTANSADLSRTSGEAVVEDCAFQGIPIKSLRLSTKAEDADLQYKRGHSQDSPIGAVRTPRPGALQHLPKDGLSTTTNLDPPLQERKGLILPKSLATTFELEDVTINQVLARGQAMGIHVPFAIAGTLSLEAEATFSTKKGLLEIPELSVQLGGKPLTVHLGLNLFPPYAFEGGVDVSGWEIGDFLAFLPQVARPAPVSGVMTVKAEAKGALAPFQVRSEGAGHVEGLRVGVFSIGNVPMHWSTTPDAIVIEGVEAQPFDGRMRLTAQIPVAGNRPTQGRAVISGVDLSKLSALLPEGNLKLAGKVDGTMDFRVPPGAAWLDANLSLAAPELTVQGIPADRLKAALSVRSGVATYDLSADSLGGKVRFRGDYPLTATAKIDEANARFQFAAFKLSGLWRAWKLRGSLSQWDGLAAIDANLRTNRQGTNLRAHGIAEVRDLNWRSGPPLGGLRGEVIITPEGWRVTALTGQLFGGPVNGEIWADTPKKGADRVGFEMRTEHASLTRIAAFQPKLARYVEGFGNLRMSGRFDESLRAEGEAFATEARFFSLPVAELHVPAELTYDATGGVGILRVRGLTARLGGGKMRSDARFQFGVGESFSADVALSALDLETLTRLLTDVRRPSGGKVSGRIHLSGTDPDDLKSLRGKVDLGLEGASLIELPVFREIDRLLGAARGGIFDDGELRGVIADRRFSIEELTLTGRLAQIHSSGAVGFDGKLDLVALVNSNQIIAETGQNLVALIPGLRNLEGRSGEATRAFSGFLSNRLLKIRVSGTLSNPQVSVDPGVVVSAAAVGFFSSVLRLPAGLLR